MSIELKIKSKHLGLEAKVIKFEEAKLKQQLRWMRKRQESLEKLEWKLQSITSHRKHEVRNENRATFLARAYIAGVPYKTVEHKVKDRDKGKPAHEGPLHAYRELVHARQRDGLYWMPCASPDAVAA